MSFIEIIKQKAKANQKRVVLPEATDIRILTAASVVMKEGIAQIILVGKKEDILKAAEGIDLSGTIIIEPELSEYFEAYVAEFFELRKLKGMTIEKARELMKDPVYFGTMMVKQSDADGLVSGAIHSTADTLRPALQIIKTAPGINLVSTFFAYISNK